MSRPPQWSGGVCNTGRDGCPDSLSSALLSRCVVTTSSTIWSGDRPAVGSADERNTCLWGERLEKWRATFESTLALAVKGRYRDGKIIARTVRAETADGVVLRRACPRVLERQRRRRRRLIGRGSASCWFDCSDFVRGDGNNRADDSRRVDWRLTNNGRPRLAVVTRTPSRLRRVASAATESFHVRRTRATDAHPPTYMSSINNNNNNDDDDDNNNNHGGRQRRQQRSVVTNCGVGDGRQWHLHSYPNGGSSTPIAMGVDGR